MPLDDAGRLRPPSNNEAETSLLGAILVNNAAYHRVADVLRPEHFAEEVHGRIFEAVAKMVDRGSVANVVTLKNLFDQDGALAEIGGGAYLARLATSVVTIVNAPHYAEVIRDCWARREVMRVAEDAYAKARDPDLDITGAAIATEMQAELDALEQDDPGIGLVSVGELVNPTLDQVQDAVSNKGRVVGVTTGLIDLNRAIGGLRAGRLYILAARPSMGKSMTCKTIAYAAARAEQARAEEADTPPACVAFFTLEMSSDEVMQALLADMTGISASRQERGEIDDNDISRLSEAGDDLRALPLRIDDTPALALAQIRARARGMKRKGGLSLIVIDHLGLMSASREAQKQGPTAGVTETTRGLKKLAKELGVPILALCQLNRSLEARDDKRPTLADLRQSGSIEEDADVVIFVYRQQYYLERSEPEKRPGENAEKFEKRRADWQDDMDRCRDLAELIIAKQRGGPVSTVRVRFEPEHSRMANLARGI